MNFKDLVESHPEIVRDRHQLSFSHPTRPDEIVAAFSRSGVVLLRQALPSTAVAASAEAFRRSLGARTQASTARAATGSWRSPWMVRDGATFPAAALVAAAIRSWAWDVVEELCGSSNVVILLNLCRARHDVDITGGVGGHQDGRAVASDVPFSLWIPMGGVTPGREPGLGFVVPHPDALLPPVVGHDLGGDYVLSEPGRLWIPPYAAGDLTIHSKFSPYFTAGYGSLSELFSLEIRAMPRRSAPAKYVDPAIYVARRNGMPTIVELRNTSDSEADAFMASADLARVADAGALAA